MNAPLLTVEGLRIRFATPTGPVEAVRGIGFTCGREKLGIVGESGSGKSQTGRALLRLSPPNAIVTARRLDFDGIDLMSASDRMLRTLRGRRIGMVLQDPKYSLNPVMTIGDQITETYLRHNSSGTGDARKRMIAMLEAVRINDPDRVARAYPHELSGGMGQRAMIAMMLIAGPDLLIADEPTSALDVTVRLQVLAILDDLVTERGMGLIFISHDLDLVASFCDRVLVMYAGRIVETLPAAALAEGAPQDHLHPYTRGLLAARPRLDHRLDRLATLDRDPSWTGDAP